MSLRKAVLLSALFFFGLACKKTGELTPAFSEGDLNAIQTDSITIFTTTIYDDSLRTDETSRNLFGIHNDAIFGITKASFYTGLELSTTQLNFPAGSKTDSLVLKMKYDGLYGNADQEMKMQVYELNQALSAETEFYNYSTAGFKSNPLALKTFIPNESDSLSGDSAQFEPHLSVALDTSLGGRIIGHGTFDKNDQSKLFSSFFGGLFITPDTTIMPASGDGAIVYFNLLSAASRLVMYYHYTGEGGQVQTGEYEFIVTAATPRFNNYKHQYEGSEAKSAVNVRNLPLCYLQAMAGMKAKIDFPFIQNLTAERNIVVNKAELLIRVAEESNVDLLPAPNRLLLITQNDAGSDVFIPDYFEGTDYYGGGYDANTKSYRFNIARYVNDIINEKISYNGLFLIPAGSAVVANRLLINSGTAQTNKLILRLTYTQL